MMASSTSLRVKELLRKRNWTTKVLAEKTGLSESYLTHIKNGTRRWNEDALRKLAEAFGLHPIELFSHRKRRSEYFNKELQIPGGQDKELNISVSAVPVVGEIPEHPYYIATQAHPEFKSQPTKPHPMFKGFIKAAIEKGK